jgi:hypothetical protein
MDSIGLSRKSLGFLDFRFLFVNAFGVSQAVRFQTLLKHHVANPCRSTYLPPAR